MDHRITSPIPRRGLLAGAGAAAIGAALVPHEAASAEEPQQRSAVDGQARLSPVTATIASPPISGFTYRHVSWLDFQPESGPATRVYGGRGVYSSGSSPYLWATVEIPSGALVRDIEWYVYNQSGAEVTALGRLWAAGTGTLFATVADTAIPSGSSTTARRSIVSSTSYGPHPLGTKLALGLNTAGTAGDVQVNGARIGFTKGAGEIGLLPTPVRAYDSRETGGRVGSGATRLITLPASLVRPGTTGVLTTITVTGSSASGHIRVYPGTAAQPATRTISFAKGETVSSEVTVGLSSSRTLRVFASHAVHVVVDVTGTIS